MSHEAILVDCGVCVKRLSNQPRLQEYRLMLPADTLKISDVIDLKEMPKPNYRTFRYLFTEDDTDVYVSNTKVIPSFWHSVRATGDQKFIRTDRNIKEIVETVLMECSKWWMKLTEGRKIEPDELEVAVGVMSQRIVNEITV